MQGFGFQIYSQLPLCRILAVFPNFRNNLIAILNKHRMSLSDQTQVLRELVLEISYADTYHIYNVAIVATFVNLINFLLERDQGRESAYGAIR